MLIIFDLDDTLVETSKCLTPIRLRRVLQKMIESGLDVLDFESAFARLMELNNKVISSREAIETFCSNEMFQTVGIEALNQPFDSNFDLDPVDGALDLLDELRNFYTLALVTMGNPAFQYQKMEKAGILPDRFSKIIVSENLNKKQAYQSLLLEIGLDPRDAIVIGDRIKNDLTPARELGCFTVHFCNGRGQIHQGPREHIDVSIESLREIRGLVSRYENKSPHK